MKRSVILTDRLGPDILSAFWTKGRKDSHSYLLHSSSHPSHVKNTIPYSQFLRLRRLCSDDSDFSNKSQEMCQFFEKRGYTASVIQTAHHRAQQTDRQSALQRVSMGLTVNRQMALKLTVNRQKGNIFTVNRQMSEPKLAVKLLRYPSTIEID